MSVRKGVAQQIVRELLLAPAPHTNGPIGNLGDRVRYRIALTLLPKPLPQVIFVVALLTKIPKTLVGGRHRMPRL